MGTRTANMSIYLPSPGETIYDQKFQTGMQYIDQHNHTGAPQNGVKLGTGSILDESITPDLLDVRVGKEVITSTTSATPVVISAIPISEGEVITVRGQFSFVRDDTTEGGGGTFLACFRRPSGGNVTIIGTADIVIKEDSSGSPTMTVTADVGTQTIHLNCVGEAAKNFNWIVFYNTTTSSVA
jgi:hypothetical protein